MPACFQLIRKSTGEAAILQEVDDEMRKNFGAEPSKDEWFLRWYDTIGFAVAMGKTILEAGELYGKQGIAKWLDENFTTDAWYQRHK